MHGRILTRIVALMCAALALWTATGETVSPVRIGLRFDRLGLVPPSVRDSAIAETARIWMPYGVVFDAVEGVLSPCPEGDLSLGVIFDLEPTADEVKASKDGNDGLGIIRFAPDGTPERSTTIHYGAVMRIATSAQVMGVQPSQWPATLRDQVVGRAVGRVLAHEVGHFLLRWPHHAEGGLMRGGFHASTLSDPAGSAFALTSVDRARFQIVLNAGPIVRPEGVHPAATCRPIAFE